MIAIPYSLSALTLEQWVGYYAQYGSALDQRRAEIALMPDGEERRMAYVLYDADWAVQSYSYYVGVPMVDVLLMDIRDVIASQNLAYALQRQEELGLSYHGVYEWLGGQWRIGPLYEAGGRMKHEQYMAVQDLALILSDLEEGRHEAMYALCAAYLRKDGEPYSAALTDADGERMQLMRSLPMDMALRVKKYVEDTISVYLTTK